MGKKQPQPPVVAYEYTPTENTRAVDEAFNYLFDRFFQQINKDKE